MVNFASTRRQLLASGLAVTVTASAGCLGMFETGSNSLGNNDQRSLHLILSHYDGPLRAHHVVDLTETRPERDEEAFEATLNGSTYTTQYRKPFFSTPEEPKYAKRDGTYYQLGSVIVNEVAETHPVLRLHEVSTDTNEASSEGVVADQLPEGDRRAVHIAHMAARARGDEGGVPWGLVQRGGYVFRQEEIIEASRLLAEDAPDHVIFRETRYEVEVTREQFYEPVYKATIELVANSPERMEAILRATFVDARISRDDLSPDARNVLREAQEDEYSETHPYSPGYREVITALHRRAFLDGNIEKDAFSRERRTSMVLYDGEYFDYRLRFSSNST